MTCHNPGCIGNYDFDQIAFFARKRFIEGCQTVTLLEQARSQREREEILKPTSLQRSNSRRLSWNKLSLDM